MSATDVMPDLNQGALAPVADEIQALDLPVTGQIPQELNGTLIRNGPNPLSGHFSGSDVLSWWPESAMLHGIELAQGRAVSYRNRWVRTQAWAAHQHGATHSTATVAGNPNVNLLQHGKELLALAEGGPPCSINAALDTLGPSQRPSLAPGMTAHPKVDAATGELIWFCADWAPPFLRYGVVDENGQATVELTIDVPAPSMMHDFAITQTHSVFLDLNVGFDPAMLAQGHRMPIRWLDERTSRLGVLPRHGGPMAWFDIEPCFVQHVVNAFDQDDGALVLDVVRYPSYFKLQGAEFLPNPLGTLWRYEIDLVANRVSERQRSAGALELPRINEQYTGHAYRYAYAVEQPSAAEMRGVVKYDLSRGSSDLAAQHYTLPPGDQNSEPVFVPRPSAKAEDDGWLLVCVYRHVQDTTDLVILNAQDLCETYATVHLPRRIPAGFHGAWVPAAS